MRPDEHSQAAGREQGASLVEYTLLIGLIAVVCIVAMEFFGTSLSESYSSNGSQLFGG